MTKVKDMEQKLEELCKDIKGLVDKPSESIKLEEVEKMQDKLRVFDELWEDGAIKEDDGTIAAGQSEFGELLNEAHEMISDLLETLPEDE